jgi:hypothetical protein
MTRLAHPDPAHVAEVTHAFPSPPLRTAIERTARSMRMVWKLAAGRDGRPHLVCRRAPAAV